MNTHHNKKKAEEMPSEGENIKDQSPEQNFSASVNENTTNEEEKTSDCKKDCSAETAEQEKKTDELVTEIEELKAKCKDLQDQNLRSAADFDNYRKRMIKEKQEAINYANTNLLLDLVQILDDFDRAIEAGKTQSAENSANAFAEGVIMIKNQMTSMLSSKYGLTYYPSKGEIFDPNIHEAVSMVKSPDVNEAKVGEELQKGYKLKDRVIRHSKVMVLMPQEKKDEKPEEKEPCGECDKTDKN